MLAAFSSIGYLQSDEHFQLIEFGAMKLGLVDPSALAWEYHAKMRPGLQPGIMVLTHRVFHAVGIESPFVVVMALRILSGLVSFCAALLLYVAFRDNYCQSKYRPWFLLLSFLFWGAVFVGVRFSSEGWSGSFFVLGFALYFLSQKSARNMYWLVGLLLGLAYLFRYQVGLLVFGFFIWLLVIQREKWRNLFLIGGGVAFMMLFGVLMDYWFYEDWTFTLLHYFDQNIVEDRVSDFGIDPWYYYLMVIFLMLIPPFSLVPMVLFGKFLFKRPTHFLIWCLLPFLLVHNLIGHKEHRFLFPLVGLLPLLIAEGMHLFVDQKFLRSRLVRFAVPAFLVLNAVPLLTVTFVPLDLTTPLYKEVYDNYQEPASLYYRKFDPYERALPIRYYRRRNVTTVCRPDFNTILVDPQKTQLLATRRPLKPGEVKFEYTLKYKALPDWVKIFNIGGWVERTKFWHLYEIN